MGGFFLDLMREECTFVLDNVVFKIRLCYSTTATSFCACHVMHADFESAARN